VFDEGGVVTAEDVAEVVRAVGGESGFGGDNRAGLEGQLHRVSAMRNTRGFIFGMTLRVGRAVRGQADALRDVLLGSRASVLVLGTPGAGKTTLIRDIARAMAEEHENVCVIDTSNEIGGDGDVPHRCIGWARRMMVPTLNAQAKVMVECLQNHTVGTMVIDEIGRQAEVEAARTVRQRGVRLVASVHGDLRTLLRNKVCAIYFSLPGRAWEASY
jgi:stage III sporulation protein SpoIIIAA